jgi:prophage regulatory protein
MTGLSKTSIYRLLSTGTFPKQISIGARTVVWIDKDIHGWMDAQIQHARGGTESVYSEVFISPCPAAKVRRTKQP